MPRGSRPGERRGGRQKGTPNKATRDAMEIAKALVDNPEYHKKLGQRLLEGSLPPAVETMLWYYAKGKPTEKLDLSGSVGVRPEEMNAMSDAQILALLAGTQATAQEMADA